MTCSLCGGDIRNDDDDGEVGWSQSAFCTVNGSRYIHYECQYERDQLASQTKTAAATAAGTASKQNTDQSQYLTLPAAAQLLGISTQTLRRRIKLGSLDAFRLAGGQTILIERAALLRLLEPL